jgi:hypothetical protein
MDSNHLADIVARLLSDAMPFREKAGDATASEAGKKLEAAVWGAANSAWETLRDIVRARPMAKGAAEALQNDFGDEEARDVLSRQLTRILTSDERLAEGLAEFMGRFEFLAEKHGVAGELYLANGAELLERIR